MKLHDSKNVNYRDIEDNLQCPKKKKKKEKENKERKEEKKKKTKN